VKQELEVDRSLALFLFSFIVVVVLFSGSRLGGVVTAVCFFFNHGEVSARTIEVYRS